MLQCALRHGPHHRLADGAVFGDQRCRNAQQFGLGLVGIAHEAALKPGAGTRQIGAGGGDHAAGAAFGGGQHLPLGQQPRCQQPGQGLYGIK
jgi:hypothetical protein